MQTPLTVTVGTGPVSFEDLVAVARDGAGVEIGCRRGRRHRALARGG